MSESEQELGLVQMRDLLLKAERIQQCFLQTATTVPAVTSSSPVEQIPVNFVETPDSLLVTAAVPGATRAEIEVRLEPAELRVIWDRAWWQALPKPHECERVRLLEIPGGRLERCLPMAPGARLQSVQLSDGLLRITLVKEAEVVQRTG